MLSLSQKEQQLILTEFPNFELSYETIAHKKVHDANILLAIPEGTKYFAWFTTYKDENVLFLLELDSTKHIINMKIGITSFTDKLSYGEGTVFYGTFFKHNGNNLFCIEDLCFYKGYNYTNYNFLEKIKILKTILQNDLSSICLFNKYVIFGMPLMHTDFNCLLREIDMLPYKVCQISFKYFESKKSVFVKYYKPNPNKSSQNQTSGTNNKQLQTQVFKVKADIQNDIYNLYVHKNGKDEFYDIAFIPDYVTSVMMNKLFRNIKENANLDALEESDDEAEFENDKEDKFVFLDKSYKMVCQFNNKFKKWVPISLANNSPKSK